MSGTIIVIVGYLVTAGGLLVGSIIMYHGNIGYLVIAGGLLVGGIIVYLGYKLNQQISEQKIIDEIKKEIAKNKEKELISQFPAGYQLFGVVKSQIIPFQQPTSKEIKISWSTAKILKVTEDLITIMLPDAILRGNIVLKSNIVKVKNQEGSTSSRAIVINGWSTFVKILKSDKNRIIAAVGYAKIR